MVQIKLLSSQEHYSAQNNSCQQWSHSPMLNHSSQLYHQYYNITIYQKINIITNHKHHLFYVDHAISQQVFRINPQFFASKSCQNNHLYSLLNEAKKNHWTAKQGTFKQEPPCFCFLMVSLSWLHSASWFPGYFFSANWSDTRSQKTTSLAGQYMVNIWLIYGYYMVNDGQQTGWWFFTTHLKK